MNKREDDLPSRREEPTMPTISICHPHTQGAISVEQVIRTHEHPVAGRYGLTTRWEERKLHVSRAGMKACIAIEEARVKVDIDVPWIFRSMVPKIEEKVRWGLSHYF